jgi:dTDP-4-amino-4,6-dideoxygalactose transaminase
MNIPFVDLKAQYNAIKPEIDSAIQNVIENTAFIGGNPVKEFEKSFADYIGVKHCIGCGNGTDAIQLALQAMEIGAGDEVIVPANSFIATSEAVTATGAKVVFCDADPHTNNLDVVKLEACITQSTKAVIAVHLYGQPADMNPIMEIANKQDLKVIEDSAQAHGAKYKDKIIGRIGDAATFSFYPGKNLGAYGDGGAMVTNNDSLAIKMKMWANHGRIDKYNHEFEAYNSRLDGMQAAILSAKLPHLNSWIDGRRSVAKKYREKLNGISALTLPSEAEGLKSVYHLYVVKTDQRDALQKYLKENGISSGVHYPIGLPFLKAYDYLGHKPEDFPVTYANQTQLLSLPIYPELTDAQINYVCENVRAFFG